MATVSIPLTDDGLARLHAQAEQAGLPAEEYLNRQVEQMLALPGEALRQSADSIPRKNAELYLRLA